MRRLLAIVLCASALSGCSIFHGKPALPEHAAVERENAPTLETDYAALIAQADIIYFPAERAASGARAEPSAMLLEALRKDGTPFAIGWDIFETSQQPLLDELTGKIGSARQEIVRRLEFAGTGRAREHCRAVLRDERFADVRHLALRCPTALLAKVEARERLAPEEEKELPRGYVAPPRGLEAYAERRATPARSYRVELAAQQFAAEKIVRYLRAAGKPSKLLAFVSGDDLEAGLGVPRYVAQKLKVRQRILGPEDRERNRSRLLTGL